MTYAVENTVYTPDFFEQLSSGGLSSARIILKEVFEVANFSSVVDIGCGVAPWLRAAIDLGARRAVGLDGAYVKREQLLVDHDYFKVCNLEQDNIFQAAGSYKFDLAMCMEVAEHLTSARAETFVAEICQLADFVIFSAAIPGQAGTDHINVQWPEYWSKIFQDNGFRCYDVLRRRLWSAEKCEWWYLQNVLIFARLGTTATQDAERLKLLDDAPPMALVHPRHWRWVGEGSAERTARYDQALLQKEQIITQAQASILELSAENKKLREEINACKQQSSGWRRWFPRSVKDA